MIVGYLCLNSIEEPLVRSQVLAYLRGLSATGIRYWLVTFEPTAPTKDREEELRTELAGLDIEWHWVSYPKNRSPLAFRRALVEAATRVEGILKRRKTNLLHARGFLPALIARRVSRRSGIPFLFDARGFWGAEKGYKGRLPMTAVTWRILDWYERRLFRQSHGVVVLSQAAGRLLRQWDPERGRSKPLEVIPTCVDTGRFLPRDSAFRTDTARLVYIGSLGAGYMPVETMQFARAAQGVFRNVELLILSRTDPQIISDAARTANLDERRFTFRSALFEEIPAALARCDAGICFIEPHYSKIASCPTKLGEYLAAGLPVVANGSIGDVGEIVESNRVGATLSGFAPDELERAAVGIKLLQRDPSLVNRCVETANRVFSLENGVSAYRRLYDRIVSGKAE